VLCAVGREAQVRQPQGEGILIPTKKYSLTASMAERREILSEWTLIHKAYQKTLNQRVQGSGPCAPTNKINGLEQPKIFVPTRRSAVMNELANRNSRIGVLT
jgi:hypothetical protein